MPLLFWPKTAERLLQYVDAHYCGEARTFNLFTFLASHEQYSYINIQNLIVKHGIHCLTFKYIFVMNYTSAVKKQNQHRLYPSFMNLKFFGGRRVWTTPFETLALCFLIKCKTPALVTSNYRVQKVWVAFDHFSKVVSVIKACSFCSAVNACGTKSHAEFPFLLIFTQNVLHDSFWYSHQFCYECTRRPIMIFLQNIDYSSNVFTHSCHRRSSASLLITNRLSPF